MDAGPRNQGGMTLLSFLFLLALGAFVGYVVLRISPIYVKFGSINSSMRTVAKTPEIESMSGHKIRELLFKEFETRGVEGIRPSHVTMKQVKGGWEMKVSLESRVPVILNLDFIGKYDRTVRLGDRPKSPS